MKKERRIMRKLGLRVLAGSLAVLMTASVLGPATPARAENDLLIAPAPIAVNTLYITEDMVDSDNEIIISGEKWDRIVVSKEAAAANIYFDEVEVGELVIESGSESVVQLWKVDAGKVTVQEPELKEIDMTGLRVLLAEEETRQQAMDYFMRVQAENEKMLRSAPLIVTMEDAAVDTISAGANVRLDLHKGDVKALNVEASAKLDRMDVTLEGYSGEVVYKGNDVFNIVNLKNVDSRISKLVVGDSAANNYLNVSSRDSLALNVEVAGDAKVSLNIPMGELNITEAAKAARVDVLNAVDNMNVSGSNAKVEIAPIGNVAKANITGDKAEIGGTGVLTEAVILGKEVYVSTKGTSVEGENCYVEPVYQAPQVVVKNTYDNMTAGATTLTKNSNGTATISFSGQYQKATFNVPANVDVNRIRSIVVEVTTGGQIGLSILTTDGTNITKDNGDGEYPGWGISEPTKKEFTYSVDPREQKVAKIELMSLNAAQPDLTLESVTFNLYEEGKVPTPTLTPTPIPLPPVEPGSLKTFTPKDCNPALAGAEWNPYTAEYLENGAIKVDFASQYNAIDFKLPEKMYPAQYGKLRIKLATGNVTKKDEVAIKLLDSSAPLGMEYGAPKPILVKYGIIKSPEGVYEIDLSEVSKYVVDGVSIMSNEGACSCNVYEITFVAKGEAENPTPGVTETPEPTPGVTETPEPTPGVTGTPEPTPGVTGTPETTPTPEATPTPGIPVSTPTPELTPTPTPSPAATPTPVVVKGAGMDVSKKDDGVNVEAGTDDAVTITFPGQYKSATFAIPQGEDGVDITRIKEITLNVTTSAHFGLGLITKQGEEVQADYPGYGITETVTKTFTYTVDPNVWQLDRIRIGSLDADQPPLTLNSITFTLYEEGKVPEATPTTPAAPSNLGLSAGSKEYQFKDMLPCAGWGNTTSTVDHDGVKAVYSAMYSSTKFTLPETLTLGDFQKVILTASSGKGAFGIELYEGTGVEGEKPVAFWWSKNAKATTDLELAFDRTGYGGTGVLGEDVLAKEIKQVNILLCVDGTDAELVLYRIAFVAE